MEFSDKNFGKKVLNSNLPVMVEFWGSWCPPCKMMEPILAKLEREYQGRIRIGKLNTDKNPNTRDRCNIRGLPTFIIFKRGKEVERHVAAKSEGGLREILDRTCGGNNGSSR